MTKITIATLALLATGFAGAAQAYEARSYHEQRAYTAADRAFSSTYGQPAERTATQPQGGPAYQGGFGSFGAAGTARSLGF